MLLPQLPKDLTCLVNLTERQTRIISSAIQKASYGPLFNTEPDFQLANMQNFHENIQKRRG